MDEVDEVDEVALRPLCPLRPLSSLQTAPFYAIIVTLSNANIGKMKSFRRKLKNYDGTEVTTHRISDLLPRQLTSLGGRHQERPDLILRAWPEVIGQKLAGMTDAHSFLDGILAVKVKNATLHSLLNHDKPRILNSLREKFPQVQFRDVTFRRG